MDSDSFEKSWRESRVSEDWVEAWRSNMKRKRQLEKEIRRAKNGSTPTAIIDLLDGTAESLIRNNQTLLSIIEENIYEAEIELARRHGFTSRDKFEKVGIHLQYVSEMTLKGLRKKKFNATQGAV